MLCRFLEILVFLGVVFYAALCIAYLQKIQEHSSTHFE